MPPKTDDPKKRRSFACTDEEWEILLRVARAEDSSVSRVLRRLIRSLNQPPGG